MRFLLLLAFTATLAGAAPSALAKYDFQKATETKYVLELHEPLKLLFAESNAGKQLDVILSQGPLAAAFKKYLVEAKAEENYEFLMHFVQQKGAKLAFEKFIAETAKTPVNISGAVRKNLLSILDAVKKVKDEGAKNKLKPQQIVDQINAKWKALDFKPAIAEVRTLLLHARLVSGFVELAKPVYAALAKKVKTGQWYNAVRLLPGDILLFVDRGWATKVSVAQGAQRLIVPFTNFGTYKGSIYTHHAAVVVDKGDGKLAVAHAVGDDGVSLKDADELTDTGFKTNKTYGSYMVFRLKDRDRNAVTPELNKVALNWTGPNKKATGYADLGDLIMPAFKSSAYWSMAAAEAKRYFLTRDKGGVAEKFFCSQLVIALYQAAFGGDTKATQTLMALHARYTSPMKLHHYLAQNSAWTHVGTETF